MGKLRLLATVLAFGGLVACGGGERTDGVVGDDAGADLVGRRCGGIAGLPCGRGEYCDPGPGQCQVADAMGVCKRKPYVCPYIYSPVCGCDGETYANSCAAAAAGEPLDHTGACVPPEKVCGGIAGLACDAGQYCEYAAGQCTVPDATGLCKPVPQACTDVYDPVCGCDGKTYPNACAAAAASVSVAAQGECAPVVKRCGGIAGLVCDTGQYCAYEVGQCLVPDAMGVCTPPPDICPSLYDPVCGCDGKTYANSCVAAVSGVSVASKGACAPTPQRCGGLAGLRCPSGQFCALPAGQCKVADAMGTCEPIPGACITLWSPVCGCDGRTYGNFCDAAAASMNVDHAGVCTSLQ